jgi:NAD(P)H-dependent flavin oxidoreductase YrpB (nitropropane dioxygenase family)
MAQEAQTTLEELIEAGKKYELAYEGNVTDGAVLLGQSIGIINSVETVSDIIESIVKGAEKYIKNAYALIR